jgi:hypothetical protein
LGSWEPLPTSLGINIRKLKYIPIQVVADNSMDFAEVFSVPTFQGPSPHTRVFAVKQY